MDDRRAHCTILSTVVVSTGISISAIKRQSLDSFLAPIEHALAPDVDVTGGQDQKEHEQLHEARPLQLTKRHRKGIEEGDFDVEEEKNHRHQVELDGMALARVADRRHAAFV